LTCIKVYVILCSREVKRMRTTVDLNDKLLKEAMKVSHTKTKRETLERGLELLIRGAHLERLRSKRGSEAITWTIPELEKWRAFE